MLIMFDLMEMAVKPLIETTLKPLTLNWKILEVAYELYLKAPQDNHPLINLREVAKSTGSSMLECRNTIVEANILGKFPNCLLESRSIADRQKEGKFSTNSQVFALKVGSNLLPGEF